MDSLKTILGKKTILAVPLWTSKECPSNVINHTRDSRQSSWLQAYAHVLGALFKEKREGPQTERKSRGGDRECVETWR